MSGWEEIREAIEAGHIERTTDLVTALDDRTRRTVTEELPTLLKAMLARSSHGFLGRAEQGSLLFAGAGTIAGPAAAATWLCHRDLRLSLGQDDRAPFCAALHAVTAFRPDQWRADVGHRVADHVRISTDTGMRWHVAATLIKSAGAATPVPDGFVVGWASHGGNPDELADDPFLDALVPKLFETDGVGAALAAHERRPKQSRTDTWAGALAKLARAGRVDRAALLDGCLGRFLRGGTAHNLRSFVHLHTMLEPTEIEAADRVRDYVQLLAAAPSTVAGLALEQVCRADGQGRLDEALFEQAAGDVLFRTEKKLVRAALTWLDGTAHTRDRVDTTLRALTTVFPSDTLELRERAVTIAAKHATQASDTVQAEIRDAAAGLPPVLRQTIAAAFGEVEAVASEAEPPPSLPLYAPREALAPISSPIELAEEFTVLTQSQEQRVAAERFIGALVEFAYRDADATRKALHASDSHHPRWIVGLKDDTRSDYYIEDSWFLFPLRSLLVPSRAPRPTDVLASFAEGSSPDPATKFRPPMERFLTWRRHEVAALVEKVPVLLATPTEASGHIDPNTLVQRLEKLEETGTGPGRADLAQAMLRLPRDIDPTAVARARKLTSTAGQAVASWLAEGGLADPAVECRILDRSNGVLAMVDVPGDSDIARPCRFSDEDWPHSARMFYSTSVDYWPSVLPSHREIAATHLVRFLAGVANGGRWDWFPSRIMLDLAAADGPAGAATGALLACTLASREQHDRVGATEALLTLCARGHLPAEETGTALGRLAALGHVKPARAVKALTAAADAGAHTAVWTILAAALPHALPEPGERPVAGVQDMLALATRTAETIGVRGAIEAVAQVAARGGSTRLVKEATRLHRTLAT